MKITWQNQKKWRTSGINQHACSTTWPSHAPHPPILWLPPSTAEFFSYFTTHFSSLPADISRTKKKILYVVDYARNDACRSLMCLSVSSRVAAGRPCPTRLSALTIYITRVFITTSIYMHESKSDRLTTGGNGTGIPFPSSQMEGLADVCVDVDIRVCVCMSEGL
jgi:hypothetical protein